MELLLATYGGYKEKNMRQFVDQNEYHHVSFFNKKAKIIHLYIKIAVFFMSKAKLKLENIKTEI